MVPGVFGLQNSELFTGVGEGFFGGAEAVVGFQVVDVALPEGLLAGDEGIDAFLIPIAGEDAGRLKESSNSGSRRRVSSTLSCAMISSKARKGGQAMVAALSRK